jgi:hypothetical protein
VPTEDGKLTDIQVGFRSSLHELDSYATTLSMRRY